MRILTLSALLLAAATPALAQTSGWSVAAPIKRGQSLYDAGGKKLGEIFRVLPDGSVRLIRDERTVTVPAATLTRQDGKLVTSLSWTDLRKL